jgi:pyruvate formate lyase activating enzyme
MSEAPVGPSGAVLEGAALVGQAPFPQQEASSGSARSGAEENALSGTVINIQRFSTHDGPGVRTTVFFKGCTNNCAWCHNPESILSRPELQVYPDRCIGCGRCLVVCPEGAHERLAEGKIFHREQCRACGRCAEECFAGGLVIAGRIMDADSVMAEIVQDEVYYRHSGGGVTFSGGEPVLQKEFLGELLRRCRERGLHTAVETAGSYPWEWLAGLLPDLALVMYDLKLFDPQLHRRYVGNSGELGRANLRRLAAAGRPLIVRTPVIGGVNDTEEEISQIARFIQDVDALVYYELLPYHALGNSKRPGLGLPEEFSFHTPSKERMAELSALARTYLKSEVRP